MEKRVEQPTNQDARDKEIGDVSDFELALIAGGIGDVILG